MAQRRGPSPERTGKSSLTHSWSDAELGSKPTLTSARVRPLNQVCYLDSDPRKALDRFSRLYLSTEESEIECTQNQKRVTELLQTEKSRETDTRNKK
jgi:hypothetical protein